MSVHISHRSIQCNESQFGRLCRVSCLHHKMIESCTYTSGLDNIIEENVFSFTMKHMMTVLKELVFLL
jgi:hypothetical protein